MFLAIRRKILGTNKRSRLAPDLGLSLRRTNLVLLIIRFTEDIVTQASNRNNKQRIRSRQLNRVTDEVMRLESIHKRQPDTISPSKIEPEMVVSDINRSEVPVFTIKEINHINDMQPVQDDHAVGDVTVLVVLSHHERKVYEGPTNDTRTTIVEQLEIEPFAETRVEFDTPEQIVNKGRREFAIFRVRRGDVGLDERKDAEQVTIHIGSNEQSTPIVVDDRGREQIKVKR